MEGTERLIRDPEQEWKEENEREYKETIESIEELYQISLGETINVSVEEINRLIIIISGPVGNFLNNLFESSGEWEKGEYKESKKINPNFFGTLPIVNKMARIYINFKNASYPLPKSLLVDKIRDISEDAKYILHQGLEAVDENTLEQLDEKKVADFFESLKHILTSYSDFSIEYTVNFLEKYKDLFVKLSKDKNIPNIQVELDALQDFLKTREFERLMVSAIQRGIEARKGNYRYKAKIEHCETLLRGVLIKYGFDPDEIFEVWGTSNIEHGPAPQIGANMETVFNIEDKRKGISGFLYKEFGIRNFERYPEEILVAQYDEFDNLEKPYGVMIQATSDWNGAFASISSINAFKDLFDQIKDEYAFRITEVKSKSDVARRLIGFDRKYGKRQKISFAFIGGHGSENSITLGGQHRRDMILTEDLTGSGVQRTSNFFEINPTIVLVSCSTGAEDGIGQKLSKALGAKIIAPRVDTNIKKIEAIMVDNGIDFKVEYVGIDDKNEENIDRTYMSGEKQG